jgi:hypothetical protein
MMEAMEFVTLHDLAVTLDKPEKVLRYHFKNLMRKNALQEGVDFIKEGYRDEQHFIYKINPESFMRVSGLSPAPVVTNDALFGTNGYHNGYQPDTNEPDVVTHFATNHDHDAAPQHPRADAEPVSVAPRAYEPDPLTLELIRTLQHQLEIKDGQIKDYREELREQQNVTNMAMGEIIKLNQALRLGPGSTVGTTDASRGYQPHDDGDTKRDPVGTQGYHDGYHTDTHEQERRPAMDTNRDPRAHPSYREAYPPDPHAQRPAAERGPAPEPHAADPYAARERRPDPPPPGW